MANAAGVTIRDVIDRNPISWFQRRTLILCYLCIVVDGLEITVVGFMSGALKDDYGITTAQLAPAVTGGLAGLAIGSFVAGPLGDRFGRRAVIVWAIGAFTVVTLATASADNVAVFSLLRVLTGIGLGASMPNVAALVSEYVPTARRRTVVALVWSGFTTGAAVGAIVVPFIVEAFGWEAAILLCGAIAAGIFIAIARALPESARFLANSGRDRDSLVEYCNRIEPGSATTATAFARESAAHTRSYPIGALFASRLRLGTTTMWIGFVAVMFTVYLTNTWLPFLFKEAGFAIGTIALLTTLLQVGGTIGCAAIGFIQDRFGAHVTLVWASVLGAAMAMSIAVSPSSTTLLAVLIFVLGMCTNSISTGYTAVSATFYPTDVRSTGTSWAAGISRVGAVAGAAVGTTLASMGVTFQQVFLLLLIPISVSAICMSLKGLYYRNTIGATDIDMRDPSPESRVEIAQSVNLQRNETELVHVQKPLR
ncbi:aromatic acid/H+ symport family MFS transporter [Nocardia sp. NPDC050799]|uniref:MFS transporter n=1 Tax=Nocardia TaxID=1817 RepID=UPI0007A75824|nr:aromatic acid/H+ symport family MFS transporter [Nocardia fusca]